MFPLRDENPTTVFAWVTLVFIAANLFVYFDLGSRARRPRSQRAWAS